ncbi:MAG: sigma-70 family RNA polymerase sigma factor [Microthrixaceae bacterium]
MLYDRYVQHIYRYAYSRVENTRVAEDITSQTFMAAYKSLGRYRERGYFSAWLFQIAQSEINNHFRRSRREVGLDATKRLAEADDALGSVIQDEELGRLQFLIKKLDNDERELIRLRYVAESMRAGSVLVDVAIDQGGCFETSHATTHDDPTYVVDDVVHYCVANMPGAVPHTSTHALNNVTLPFVLALADQGATAALLANPHLLGGLNVCRGFVTESAVAEALGYEYVPPADALAR